MPIAKKVLKYLEDHKVSFKTLEHKVVYTAYDTAQTLRRKLQEIAKTLLIKTDKGYALVIVPASRMVDLQKVKKILKVKRIEIAKERTMKTLLTMKSGSIVPFAKLYRLKKKGAEQLPVYIDSAFTRVKKIVASAGTFTESLEMSVKNFLKATEAKKVSISKARTGKK
ncbi:MAG: hypothetical protein A3B74_02355 [Candidatus Kerfeldbacteria bacterium RIFCSPHIGHO2_02_FULL_42_14]|uniref:YbaK/aminoacyl-tRNA synthetase-associated domain-containing protein n=1 Tax=Candidatus Kerfeldbacteria bacterium RIFCSPHIGHO2_02_FULL_42_14 TaxID=1798540 RepID=A0A1G2ASF1_9BACT|nr:MAG: hypothetical protein A3B74_02355 [Candidatus Kerfeldbacteria bacterium RIFCSPHIGHO2_02_FULL_42_14]OGY80389.1 MAG: hypothetical protein A3E60_04975 [Candidatus Kerfeldbacteria bacterium RIFCSPHIGHO2_12_FULL_42_13]OGY83818.1 MAG: hypothetical protein A3I91_04500 [Candidatus Kerfeldbacteria bacterium RIFCSPLOWO2_02_FULL_42_19]OGY85408.1 MAG: hypothetical protein A3G01_02365 [Candidatus Kerfeldbacteria bacterium RIFCSPLOWO2_12_FULL_43_9]